METLRMPTNTSENLNSKHVEYMESVNLCPLCGSKLDFRHITNHINRIVKEEAFCPKCNIRTKAQDYCLQ